VSVKAPKDAVYDSLGKLVEQDMIESRKVPTLSVNGRPIEAKVYKLTPKGKQLVMMVRIDRMEVKG
jgi:DNA-binding PadR family transcriptional regulator